MRDLSVIIAARNERYLKPTVEDVLRNTSDRTDVIVVCDGTLPVEPLVQHPRVNVLLLPAPVGQRAAVNLGARLSDARFICKLDAHCSIAAGFDYELIAAGEALGQSVIQIPRQKHLHVFNWKCHGCGTETYQGPTPTMCNTCAAKGTTGGPFEQVWMWEPRQSRWRTSTEAPKGGQISSDTWRFDHTLHFQYFPEWQRQFQEGDFVETMSCLGACWFLSREYFWSLGGLDETLGSWGQMGQELSCKAWLSGGRMITNRRTHFAHLFRTKGGEWGFPYPLSNEQVEHARNRSREIWLINSWSGQVRPLSWLIDKFAPVPDWHDVVGSQVLDRVTREGLVFSNTRTIADLAEPAGKSSSHFMVGPGGQSVPLGAERLPLIGEAGGRGHVAIDAVVDQLQMRGVTAGFDLAHVVDDKSVSTSAAHRDRTDEPRIHETVAKDGDSHPSSEVGESIAAGHDSGLPQPAAGVGIDDYLRKDSGERDSVEVRDCEKLGVSHDSASCAGRRLGPDECDQHSDGPPIVRHSSTEIPSSGERVA